MKVVYQLYTKKLNRRSIVTMLYNEEESNYGISIRTKKLESKQTREIIKSDTYFTLETFLLLNETLNLFLNYGCDNEILLQAVRDYNNSDSKLKIYKFKQ